MEQMYLSIQQEETGRKIKKLLFKNGYTVKDVQSARGGVKIHSRFTNGFPGNHFQV